MTYTVTFTKRAVKDLKSIPQDDRRRILRRIEAMEDDLAGDGKKEFVVLPYDEYLEIRETLEDFEDLKELRAAKAEAAAEVPVPLDSVRAEILDA